MNLLLAADNIQPMNPVIARAIENLDPEPIRRTAVACQKAGARYIDVNPGYLSPRKMDRMGFLVETIQEACDLTLILDSAQPEALAVGLEACRARPVLNAVSLETEKLDRVLPLAVDRDLDLVALFMDERSMTPPTLEEKIGLAAALRDAAESAGLPAENLIFDPVLPSLSWPDAFHQAGEVVRTVRLLAGGGVFGEPVRTMAGLSNLRSSRRSIFPVDIETACLTLLAGAGLEIILANALDPAVTAALAAVNRMA
jgi:cobalamin-dependent methionine synthase I